MSEFDSGWVEDGDWAESEEKHNDICMNCKDADPTEEEKTVFCWLHQKNVNCDGTCELFR